MSNTKSDKKKKPQKRLEYKGKNVRVSRTGGVAVTKTFKKDGVGATLNTKQVSVCINDYLRVPEWGFKTVIFNLLEDTIVVLLILMFQKLMFLHP